jgi:hypothetical protein
MKGRAFRILGMLMALGSIYLLLLIYPNPLFAYKYQYRNFELFSDKPIPESITLVVDDVMQRIEKSELYKEEEVFRIYLCNNSWRFKFFTRTVDAGGVVNFLISSNIFIRKNNINSNQLIPPESWKNPLTDRPLSYFIAHEAIHSLQRKHDKWLTLKEPVEIVEGYADYLAKNGSNSIESLTLNLKSNSPNMDPQNGLYDRYNLLIAYLIEVKGYSFEEIVKSQVDIDGIFLEIMLD